MFNYFAVIFAMLDMITYYDVYNVTNTTNSSYTLTFSHQTDNFTSFEDSFADYDEVCGNVMDNYCPPSSGVCYLPTEDNGTYFENISFGFDRNTSSCFIDFSQLVNLDWNVTFNTTLNTSFYVGNSTNFTGSGCFEYLFDLPEFFNHTFSFYENNTGFTTSSFCA